MKKKEKCLKKAEDESKIKEGVPFNKFYILKILQDRIITSEKR